MGFYYISDELYHHGVKGMKWGVRRAEKRNAKHIEKMTAYRDKLVDKSSRKAARRKKEAQGYANELADLKKNGKSSDSYKKYLKSQVNSVETLSDLADLHSKTFLSNELLNTRVSDVTTYHRSATSSARKWAANSKTLKNTTITAATKKKDLKKMYKKDTQFDTLAYLSRG